MRHLVCTIITKSHLAHARALAESVREHNPDLPPLLVLLADRVDGYFDPTQEPFQMIQLEDLPCQEIIQAMSFYYTAFEFCNALRAYLHEYILTHTLAENWMYLDSDILVCHDLGELFDEMQTYSIVLTPHLTSPVHFEDLELYEVSILHWGLYNSGFLGLKRSNETRAFVSWFKERLRWYCFDDHPFLYVDQPWLNHVPLFFSNVLLLRKPNVNLAHWNLRGRHISKDISGYNVDGVPLQFAHFSGWDPATPEHVSKYNPRLNSSTCPGWDVLGADYAQRLHNTAYDAVRTFPYAFDAFDEGYPILRGHRRAYYTSIREQTWSGGNPFSSRREFIALEESLLPFWRRLVRRLRRSVKTWGL
jgi:hypothetical protein